MTAVSGSYISAKIKSAFAALSPLIVVEDRPPLTTPFSSLRRKGDVCFVILCISSWPICCCYVNKIEQQSLKNGFLLIVEAIFCSKGSVYQPLRGLPLYAKILKSGSARRYEYGTDAFIVHLPEIGVKGNGIYILLYDLNVF